MRKLVFASAIACVVVTLACAQTNPPAKNTATPSPTAAATPAAPNPKVTFHTTAGDLNCELFKDKSPVTVDNFIGLATGTKEWKDPRNGRAKKGTPLYDGTIFHRVIPNFMIQGGDPTGTGRGDPGYSFQDEFSPDLRFDRPGRLAMANSGPNTNGSQFFVTEVPTPHLNNRHTIFGQCDDPSVEIVKQIARMPANSSNKPDEDVKITSVDITGIKPPEPARKAGKAVTARPKASPKAAPKTSPRKQQ